MNSKKRQNPLIDFLVGKGKAAPEKAPEKGGASKTASSKTVAKDSAQTKEKTPSKETETKAKKRPLPFTSDKEKIQLERDDQDSQSAHTPDLQAAKEGFENTLNEISSVFGSLTEVSSPQSSKIASKRSAGKDSNGSLQTPTPSRPPVSLPFIEKPLDEAPPMKEAAKTEEVLIEESEDSFELKEEASEIHDTVESESFENLIENLEEPEESALDAKEALTETQSEYIPELDKREAVLDLLNDHEVVEDNQVSEDLTVSEKHDFKESTVEDESIKIHREEDKAIDTFLQDTFLKESEPDDIQSVEAEVQEAFPEEHFDSPLEVEEPQIDEEALQTVEEAVETDPLAHLRSDDHTSTISLLGGDPEDYHQPEDVVSTPIEEQSTAHFNEHTIEPVESDSSDEEFLDDSYTDITDEMNQEFLSHRIIPAEVVETELPSGDEKNSSANIDREEEDTLATRSESAEVLPDDGEEIALLSAEEAFEDLHEQEEEDTLSGAEDPLEALREQEEEDTLSGAEDPLEALREQEEENSLSGAKNPLSDETELIETGYDLESLLAEAAASQEEDSFEDISDDEEDDDELVDVYVLDSFDEKDEEDIEDASYVEITEEITQEDESLETPDGVPFRQTGLSSLIEAEIVESEEDETSAPQEEEETYENKEIEEEHPIEESHHQVARQEWYDELSLRFDEASQWFNNEYDDEASFSLSLSQLREIEEPEQIRLLFDLANDELLDPSLVSEYLDEEDLETSSKAEVSAQELSQSLEQTQKELSAPRISMARSSMARNTTAKSSKPVIMQEREVVRFRKIKRPAASARFMGFLIDSVGILILTTLLSISGLYIFDPTIGRTYMEGTPLHISSYYFAGQMIALCFLFSLFAYPLAFFLCLQQTWGNMVTQTRLVSYKLTSASNYQIMLRVICFPLSLLCFGYVPIIFGKNALHDYASQTALTRLSKR